MKKLFLVPLMVFLFIFQLQSQTRIVTIGNSITEGWGLSNPGNDAWPSQLAAKLGGGYKVLNCAVSARTMLKKGDIPYWNEQKFKDAQNFDPQIVIICLGTNDSKPQNWQYKNDFYNDYASMVNTFRANGKNPRIFVCLITPAFYDNLGIRTAVIRDEIIPIIKQVRDNLGTSYINFYDQLLPYGGYFTDGIHPNVAGATIMAQVAYNSIVGTAGKSGTYSLQNRNSGQYLDISGGSTADGATVLQWPGTGGANQKFTLNEISSGVYNIVSVSSGKLIDISGASTDNGANCVQWSFAGGNNQRYTLLSTDNGYYKLKAVHSSRVLDVYGASTVAGTKIIQWDDNNQSNAQWQLISTTKSANIVIKTEGEKEIVCYPNPADDHITLQNIPASSTITLFDLNGHAQLTAKSGNDNANVNVDISKLNPGAYYIKIDKRGSLVIKLLKR